LAENKVLVFLMLMFSLGLWIWMFWNLRESWTSTLDQRD